MTALVPNICPPDTKRMVIAEAIFNYIVYEAMKHSPTVYTTN